MLEQHGPLEVLIRLAGEEPDVGLELTEYFLRLRPLAERGGLAGTTPLTPVLSQVAAVP